MYYKKREGMRVSVLPFGLQVEDPAHRKLIVGYI